jgi:hypothetical protein
MWTANLQYFMRDFSRDAAEICAVLGYYAASGGNYHYLGRNNREEGSSLQYFRFLLAHQVFL